MYGLIDMFGDLGGLFEALKIICHIFLITYTRLKKESSMINQHFQYFDSSKLQKITNLDETEMKDVTNLDITSNELVDASFTNREKINKSWTHLDLRRTFA